MVVLVSMVAVVVIVVAAAAATRKVSDHYPIEMELCGKVNRDLQKQLSSCLSVTVEQKTPIEREHDIRKIYRATEGAESAHFSSRVNYEDSRMLEVVAKRQNVDDVVGALQEFQVNLCSRKIVEGEEWVEEWRENRRRKGRMQVK
ncbi:deoxyribonuclease-1-like [Elysia marginata]|uniref:Deoxyribonuclease-1-like n=1 Tax=Elysia marginata TaxID=1093978 RepID=A0AAV4EZ38_9GAST|nr:deoxyribonuclease-1-like [Elysia marginata]